MNAVPPKVHAGSLETARHSVILALCAGIAGACSACLGKIAGLCVGAPLKVLIYIFMVVTNIGKGTRT